MFLMIVHEISCEMKIMIFEKYFFENFWDFLTFFLKKNVFGKKMREKIKNIFEK